MNQDTLQELFIDQIRDLYDAEKQLVKALPKLVKAADSEDLAEGLRGHLEETLGQVARLEQIFELLGEKAKGKPCKAMKGLVEEGGEAIQENKKGEKRDLAIIAAAQRVEHYEISAYGTAKAMADCLGLRQAVDLLQQTEDQEKNADQKLTQVAEAIYGSVGDQAEDDEEEMATAASSSQSSNNSRAQKGSR